MNGAGLLFTKKEFATILNCSTKELAVYASPARRKVEYTSDGMVDGSVDKHIAFVALKRGKDGLTTPSDLRSLLPTPAPALTIPVKAKKEQKPLRQPRAPKAPPRVVITKKEDLVVDAGSFDDEDENIPLVKAPPAFDVEALRDKNGNLLLTLEQSERMKKHNDAYLAQENWNIAQLKKDKMAGYVVPTSLIAPIFTKHNHALLTGLSDAIEDILRKFSKIADLTGDELAQMKGECIASLNAGMEKVIKTSERLVDMAVDEFIETKKM